MIRTDLHFYVLTYYHVLVAESRLYLYYFLVSLSVYNVRESQWITFKLVNLVSWEAIKGNERQHRAAEWCAYQSAKHLTFSGCILFCSGFFCTSLSSYCQWKCVSIKWYKLWINYIFNDEKITPPYRTGFCCTNCNSQVKTDVKHVFLLIDRCIILFH